MTRSVACALCASLVLAAPVSAQDAAERARLLFERGVGAMDRGAPGEAAVHFEQSYQLFPRASTACNMAVAQERLARPCDAQRWYRQCAALDRTGSVRDHANRQAEALGARCASAPVHDPFVRGPSGPTTTGPTTTSGGGRVYVVEGGGPSRSRVEPDHALLGVGIGALVVGGGALVGGALAALEAQAEAAQIQSEPGSIPEGSADADHYGRAATLSDVALGLYVGGGLVGALGLVLIVVDLAQPGVFGGQARREGPMLVIAPTPGGAFAELALRF